MNANAPTSVICLLHGPDKPGIVAKVSGWIFDQGGNIIHADQHTDHEAGIFFQRIEWSHPAREPSGLAGEFQDMAAGLGMKVKTALSTDRPKLALFVSKIGHCFHDFILRWQAGEFRGGIACVISNHNTLANAASFYGLPFYHVPVTRDSKPRAESEQLRLIKEHEAELIILARYMQVLTPDFLEKAAVPVINVHHSFLPAFAGAKPYHQAHARGVKIIGATAHYATAELDQGPIIQQAVAGVNHRHSVEDLIRKGRDLEKLVLSQAARWHLENRILTYANKTVVFD